MKESEIYRKCHEFLSLIHRSYDNDVDEIIIAHFHPDYKSTDRTSQFLITKLTINESEFKEILDRTRNYFDLHRGVFKATSAGYDAFRERYFLNLAKTAEKEEDEKVIRKFTLKRLKIESVVIWLTALGFFVNLAGFICNQKSGSSIESKFQELSTKVDSLSSVNKPLLK